MQLELFPLLLKTCSNGFFLQLVGLVSLVSCRVVSEKVLVGTAIPDVGERGRLYLTLHCQHHNDFCTKTGSGVSHYNVSLDVTSKTQCP